MTGRHGIGDDLEMWSAQITRDNGEAIPPGATGSTESEIHGEPLTDFGVVQVPEHLIEDYQVSLISNRPDSDPDTLVLSGHGTQRSVTVYALPNSWASQPWEAHFDQINTSQAVAAGARSLYSRTGAHGPELNVSLPDRSHLSYITVFGPRWVMRVITRALPGKGFVELQYTRTLIAHTTVRRGEQAWPAGMALPMMIPEGWAENSA